MVIAQRAPSSPNQGASLGLGLGHHQPCLGLLGHLYGQLLNSQVSDLAPSSPTSTSSTRVPQQPSCSSPLPIWTTTSSIIMAALSSTWASATFLVTTEANVHCAAGLFINNLWYRLMLTYFHSKLSQIFSPHHHSWVKVSKFLKNLDPAATVLSTAKVCPLK